MAARPGVLLYTDIFQLTESTLRTARRLASYGFVVVVPEIYPHGELAGVALEFDDAGKAAGQAGAAATAVADFDADRVAVLDWMEQRDDVDETVRHRVLHRRSPRVPGGVRPRASRPPSASTRPACTTAPWVRTPTRARWLAQATSTAG